eukprot:g41135.t1
MSGDVGVAVGRSDIILDAGSGSGVLDIGWRKKVLVAVVDPAQNDKRKRSSAGLGEGGSELGLLYIRETKRRLGEHFVEHLCSVRDKRQHLPVMNHFNSHSLGDMSVLGLLHCHNDATQKLEERHLNFALGTYINYIAMALESHVGQS